jgi:hypothetical protein
MKKRFYGILPIAGVLTAAAILLLTGMFPWASAGRMISRQKAKVMTLRKTSSRMKSCLGTRESLSKTPRIFCPKPHPQCLIYREPVPAESLKKEDLQSGI